MTWRIRLAAGERLFPLWTGLKGAVPILLGMFMVSSGIAGGQRAYDMIFVIVAFSVVVQGGLVLFMVNRLRILVTIIEPEPWSLGVRIQLGTGRAFTTSGWRPAPRRSFYTTIGQLAKGRVAWVSAIVRAGHLVTASADTLLQPDDEVAVLAEPDAAAELTDLFEGPTPGPQRADGANGTL